MENVVQRAPSVGSVIKKILVINPLLGAEEIIALVRQSIQPQGALAGDFASAEVIDEEKAIRLARETLESHDHHACR